VSRGEPDPVLAELREQVSETDRSILNLVNKRLELVGQIKRHKASRGIAFLDPAREEQLLASLRRENPGPLSPKGLDELFRALLDLSKREIAL
jgi:chorismate mutase